MTKEKFRALCEEVLIPVLADRLSVSLTDLQESVDIMANELLRLSCAIEDAFVIANPEHGDN